MVSNPCDWTIDDLKIIAASDYSLDDVQNAWYVSNSNGKIKFGIEYEDLESGDIEQSHLFVYVNSKGKWCVEF